MRSEPDCTGRCRNGISLATSRCAAISAVGHVARMRGGVAQPQQARDVGQFAHQPAEVPGAAIRRLAVPGVDVLAQQGDLARALRHQPAGLGQHRRGRAALLRAAGIGHHAEAAEPVAAFLDAEEGAHALRRRLLRQEVEFLFRGEIRIDHRPGGAGGLRHHLRQPMIGLRPEHDVHIGRAGQDFRAFRLGDAAGHRQDHLSARGGARIFQTTQAAELGEHLLGGFFADVAGVEDHHVRAIRLRGRRVAQRRQHILHPGAVVHVHLAAPGDHVQPLAGGCGKRGVRRGGHQQAGSAMTGRTSPTREGAGIRVRCGGVKRDSAKQPRLS